ncbi:rho guanine nucleotide exchange factor 11 isoform X1 [Latimeria chalumnae]|uniref:rho guanine nucleotide exchange factor 11 isoform X1 n=1 Tax=Latimeria chalumnae TaxID=7897 RepID=UPI0003C12E36|nr:PREDICTED: rho guanine nucleotide exchange factor 11 isoform X2 [Latimeria chalumnae]|eukprot:XP_006004250.1 PREDICTED: rho guanine nucleotide exchange factor 11 isoform X2 [Latimeria chalumnae]
MSVRPPQTTFDRLSSLSLGDSVPDRRSSGHQRQFSDASEATGLVQRCVVVQKDQLGFGFTVSGDRIVLVQSVKPGGAAMRAGVQEGDRIIKVNGTLVTNSSHIEVVKLIKSGAYVALTLLGPPPSSSSISLLQEDPGPGMSPQPPPPPPLPPPIMLPCSSTRITGPKPLQDPEVQKHATQILKNMLKQEEAELAHMVDECSRSPSSSLEERIEGAKRRVSQLQIKIKQEMGFSTESVRSRSEPGSGCIRLSEGRSSQDSQDSSDSGIDRSISYSEPRNRTAFYSDVLFESPHTSPVMPSRVSHHHRQGSETFFTTEQNFDRLKPQIIDPEEVDFDSTYFIYESDGPFQDIEKLKSRPAHMAVFMRYIFSQADPNPLLFYLCAEVYQQSSSKDARSLGKEIWNIFLDRNAPLRVKISETISIEIECRLRGSEESRIVFCDAQEFVLQEIRDQILDYRSKRTMGLGSLYGENDLLEVDGDLMKERQMAERQIAQLDELISKYEEERSTPMAFAVSTYMRYVGIKVRDARPISMIEKSVSLSDRDKWLPFFPKTKKQSGGKKEKDREAMDDKKRNPIFKYIAKPKGSSQSTFHVPLSPTEVKPGNVRNIIQHFESNNHNDFLESGPQRLSTGSFPEELLDNDGSRTEVKLGRSESLKGREELKKSRKVENVPRSRSDVDMDAAAEATKLHQSASSSASSLSTRSLENPTPPYTPKTGRRSMDSPNLGCGGDYPVPHLTGDDFSRSSDIEAESESQNWQHTIGREVLAHLDQREIDRQEVINELFVTESSHLRILRVLDQVFYQRMKKESILSRDELTLIFQNLSTVIDAHTTLSDSIKKVREEGPIVKEIGDVMLSRFDGKSGEEFQAVVAEFCSNQSFALELIKVKQKKDQRFHFFMQEAESNPQCRRLQLKDLIVSEMQRLTKYPLLLDNIIKYTDGKTSEHQKLCCALDCCRRILKFVNEAVKEAENRQRLEDYQKRLDATPLERTNNPLAAEFKNLDLTVRRMIHEGPLTWRVSKDKTIDLLVLLLEDLLVLLQKQDDKLVLKCHSKVTGSSDGKQSFSPVIKLNSVLIRAVATDKKALFIICTSELGPQIYELVAGTSSEKNTWQELLDAAVSGATKSPQTSWRSASSSNYRPQPAKPPLRSATSVGGSTSLNEVEMPSEDDNQSDVTVTVPPPLPGESESRDLDEDDEDATTPTQSEGGRPPEELEPRENAVHPAVFEDGVADSALLDVENLRLLILRTVLPRKNSEVKQSVDALTEPEDDITPTPSLIGGAMHPWDTVLTNQISGCREQPTDSPEPCDHMVDKGTGNFESGHLGFESHQAETVTDDHVNAPYLSNTGLTQDIHSAEEGSGQSESQETEPLHMEGQSSGDKRNVKVVRKAEGAGTNVDDVAAVTDSNQSQMADTEGGIPVDGNVFYLAMPTGPVESSTDDVDSSSACPETESATKQRENRDTLDVPGSHPAETGRPTSHGESSSTETKTQSAEPAPYTLLSPQKLVIQDVEEIFKTIEQLTLKLHRLKEIESAHRELLKSLGERCSDEGLCEKSTGHRSSSGSDNTQAHRESRNPQLPPSLSQDGHEGPSSDNSAAVVILSTGC